MRTVVVQFSICDCGNRVEPQRHKGGTAQMAAKERKERQRDTNSTNEHEWSSVTGSMDKGEDESITMRVSDSRYRFINTPLERGEPARPDRHYGFGRFVLSI